MSCLCFIVPGHVLDRFAGDSQLSPAQRKMFSDTAAYEQHWRKLRSLTAATHALARGALVNPQLAPTPAVTIFDCAGGTSLPGMSVSRPGAAADATAQRAHALTKTVARFFKTVFGRNSIDDRGMTLLSSVHFSTHYNNAFWNGSQMTYGDGDGSIFIDFTQADDVVCHELMHGVTQYTAQLAYADEAGALNESLSDVFGSMFRQWRAKQTVAQATWRIGADILGPGAQARGFACLRDLADPGGKHCMAAQPAHYSQYQAGMNPHLGSGIANRAFHQTAMCIGGKSWTITGQIWYRALTAPDPDPQMKMRVFADRTRTLARSMYPRKSAIFQAVDDAWSGVGL